MATNDKSIVIVEDEMLLAGDLKLSLEDSGYRVVGIAMSAEDALLMIERDPPDMVLVDITLGGKMDGIVAAGRIIEEYSIPVIYITGNSDDLTIGLAGQSKPVGILSKPIDYNELLSLVDSTLGG
jgi:DNA-binding NtrC family response regulator